MRVFSLLLTCVLLGSIGYLLLLISHDGKDRR